MALGSTVQLVVSRRVRGISAVCAFLLAPFQPHLRSPLVVLFPDVTVTWERPVLGAKISLWGPWGTWPLGGLQRPCESSRRKSPAPACKPQPASVYAVPQEAVRVHSRVDFQPQL